MKLPGLLAWIAWLTVAAGCKDNAAKPRPSAPPVAGETGSGSAPIAAAAPATDGIKLPNVPPRVGDKRTKAEDLTMKTFVEAAPGKQVEVVSMKREEETQEVLAVDGDVITRLKVTYGVQSEQRTTDGKTNDKTSPLAGKTYVVWREAGKLHASREDGSAPPPDELAAVVKGNRRVGRPAVMEKILGDHRWKPGERVELTADQLKQIADARDPDSDEPAPSALSLTLTRTEGSAALFTMTVTLATKTAKGWMEMALSGTMTGDLKTGRQHEMQLVGPFQGNLGKPITGTMQAKTTYTY
jgi:hypothetical protein